MISIAERVAAGAAWLDEHYPTWWEKIEISTLNVASCHHCVLGQVYTGCIPADEQDQVLAQAILTLPWAERRVAREAINSGDWGGFNTLIEYHGLLYSSAELGFSTAMFGWFDRNGVVVSMAAEMAMLTDEWTRLVISRRLAPYRAELALVAA